VNNHAGSSEVPDPTRSQQGILMVFDELKHRLPVCFCGRRDDRLLYTASCLC
jgi:hypothetical protein